MANNITKSQLAQEYGVTTRTLYNWIKLQKKLFIQYVKVGAGLISNKLKKDIYLALGEP